MQYKRILLKVSGEGLMQEDKAINPMILEKLVQNIKAVLNKGYEVALVCGSGNLFRGVMGVASGMDRVVADSMGMLATTMNALAISDALNKAGIENLVQSSIKIACTNYIEPLKARNALKQGKVVVFAGGTGNPFFTTDTAAILRALETECDLVLKSTAVDGVYDSDPKKNANAKRFDTISYTDILKANLKVMDLAAIALARDAKLPVMVYNQKKLLLDVLENKELFTLITE